MLIQVYQASARDGGLQQRSSAPSELTGLPPAPLPQVEVTFDIDANGIVHVREGSWHRQGAVDDDLRRLVAAEGRHRADDARQRARGGGTASPRGEVATGPRVPPTRPRSSWRTTTTRSRRTPKSNVTGPLADLKSALEGGRTSRPSKSAADAWPQPARPSARLCTSRRRRARVPTVAPRPPEPVTPVATTMSSIAEIVDDEGRQK